MRVCACVRVRAARVRACLRVCVCVCACVSVSFTLLLAECTLSFFHIARVPPQADLSNGVKILWDGRTRVYVTAPSSLRGHTQGLCGTFDNNQNNDLMTREHIVENNANRFGNSWKTQASCRDVPDVIPPSPCETDVQRKQQAKLMCDKLLSDVFKRELLGQSVCVCVIAMFPFS